jgi:hypothetical protein
MQQPVGLPAAAGQPADRLTAEEEARLRTLVGSLPTLAPLAPAQSRADQQQQQQLAAVQESLASLQLLGLNAALGETHDTAARQASSSSTAGRQGTSGLAVKWQAPSSAQGSRAARSSGRSDSSASSRGTTDGENTDREASSGARGARRAAALVDAVVQLSNGEWQPVLRDFNGKQLPLEACISQAKAQTVYDLAKIQVGARRGGGGRGGPPPLSGPPAAPANLVAAPVLLRAADSDGSWRSRGARR